MKENFFIIDADNLDDIRSNMYGIAFDSTKFISDADDFDENVYTSYSGSFITIKKSGNIINIYQDINGSHGIYIYKEENYFAISNSFIYLFEYLHFSKNKKLTINFDYACHFLTIPMCSIAYSSTLCSQINILSANSEINIYVDKRTYYINTNKILLPNTLDIYSEEALELIDHWINKWASLIQNLQLQNLFTEIDVTGGFDSRITLSLALTSDIDLSKINFCSAINYPVEDDFSIANTLATEFNFSINSKYYASATQYLATADSWNMSMMTNLGSHHFPYFKNKAYTSSIFKLTGQGGETIRKYWYYEPYTFEKKIIENDLSEKNISLTAIKFLWDELAKLDLKYNVSRTDEYRTLVHHLYNETRSRYHFGRSFVTSHITNYITLAPLLDFELRRINCISNGNTDYNLLIAVILTRINKKLVDIPFNSGKAFTSNCIERAMEINSKHKFIRKINEYPIPKEIIKYIPDSTYEKSQESPMERLKKLASTDEIKKIIAQSFGEKFYTSSMERFTRPGHHPEQEAFKILAVAKIANPSSSILIR